MASAEGDQIPQLGGRASNSVFRRLERHVQGEDHQRTHGNVPPAGYHPGYRGDNWLRRQFRPPTDQISPLGNALHRGTDIYRRGPDCPWPFSFTCTGMAISSRLGKAFFNITGKILTRTPLVGSIYGLTQTGGDCHVNPVPLQPRGLPGVAQGRHDRSGVRNGSGCLPQHTANPWW